MSLCSNDMDISIIDKQEDVEDLGKLDQGNQKNLSDDNGIFIDKENDYNLDLKMDNENINKSGLNTNTSKYKSDDVDINNNIYKFNCIYSNDFLNNIEKELDHIIKNDKMELKEDQK